MKVLETLVLTADLALAEELFSVLPAERIEVYGIPAFRISVAENIVIMSHCVGFRFQSYPEIISHLFPHIYAILHIGSGDLQQLPPEIAGLISRLEKQFGELPLLNAVKRDAAHLMRIAGSMADPLSVSREVKQTVFWDPQDIGAKQKVFEALWCVLPLTLGSKITGKTSR